MRIKGHLPLPTLAADAADGSTPAPALWRVECLELCGMLFSQDLKVKDIPINLPSVAVKPQEGDRTIF